MNINTYILLALSIACAFANNVTLHRFSNRGLDGMRGVLCFNSAALLIWMILLFSKGVISGLAFDVGSVIWGVIYGLVSAMFLLCKMQALATGPVSLTSFIGCASLLISTGFGVFILHESATVLQTIGVVLLCVSLFLTVAPKTGAAEKSWKYWCAAFFICSAATGIIFKLHQRSASAEKVDEMLMISAVTAASVFALTAVIVPGKSKPGLPKSAIPYVILCGIFACAYNRLNVTLAGALPGVVFFPIFNGAVIILSMLAGLIFFGERLKASQLSGMAIGFVALMLASGSLG